MSESSNTFNSLSPIFKESYSDSSKKKRKGMSWFKERMKRKVRKSTGQEEPYTRPEGSEDSKPSKKGGLFKGYSDKEVDEINEARKKWLKERAKKK